MARSILLNFFGSTRGSWIDALRGQLEFLGGSAILLGQTIKAALNRPFYFNLFIDQCYAIGVKSFSLVAVTALCVGMVMSLQFGLGLQRFGGTLYVPKVVALSIMRELGPVMTCIMLAGRVGSGFAAEIGSMKVTQQIDAIRALGTDPLKKIVVPRLLALLLMCPILTVMADLVGITGGMIISGAELNISMEYYYHEAITELGRADFLVGFLKTFVFALIIGVTGCFYGLETKGGTQGVGRSTTHAVVTSCTLIMLADIIMTKISWILEAQ